MSSTKGERILGKLTLNEWTIGASGFLSGFWLLLAVCQFRPELKPPLRPYIAATATVAVILGICAGLWLSRGSIAIVVQPDTPIRQAPIAESQLVFKGSDGAELRVIDRKDEWLQVSAGPGRLGWIQLDKVQVLKATGALADRDI